MGKVILQIIAVGLVPMAEEGQPTGGSGCARHSTSLGVFVQNISSRVMEIYEGLQQMSNITKDARLAVLKSTRVRPKALIRLLEDFRNDCECPDLKKNVQSVIYSVEEMLPGGETRLFVCHSKKSLKTKLEFVCVAVRMYKHDHETACDFCVSTYSYSKSIDMVACGAGASILSGGVSFGALAGLGFTTGGVGFVIAGSVAAILGIVTIVGGSAMIAEALNTDLEENMRDILEASFLRELVSRGHAVLQGGRLFITQDESDSGHE